MTNILLIGYGSVAKNYLLAAKSLNKKVFYYDIVEHKNAEAIFYDIETKVKSEKPLPFESIVFCDYAFTRTKNYRKVKDLEAKKFIFEKLICNDIEDVQFLRSEKEKLRHVDFRTHLKWNLLGLDRKIFELQNKYDLGELSHFTINAGNCCLSMGGAHWIGLFLNIFKINSADFLNVSSNIEVRYESPRSKDIPVLSGIISLFLDQKLKLCLNFSPESHVAPLAIFLFKYGRILMTFEGNMKVEKIDGERNLANHIYRSPVEIDKKYSAVNPNLNPFSTLLEGKSSDVEFEHGLMVSEIIVCSLINNNNGVDRIENIKNSKEYFNLKIT